MEITWIPFLNLIHTVCILYVFYKPYTYTLGMNGDQGTTRNNAFHNVPKKNYHSQGIIISSHSLSFPFL